MLIAADEADLSSHKPHGASCQLLGAGLGHSSSSSKFPAVAAAAAAATATAAAAAAAAATEGPETFALRMVVHTAIVLS